jgi:predicted phage terminase large subunit-like protein
VFAQLEFLETRARSASSRSHPKAALKLVEDKANGPAIISTLRRSVPGLIAIEPDGDKIARTRAAAPFIEAGNVWLPNDAHAARIHREWTEALLACPSFVPTTHRKELAPATWLPAKALHVDWIDRFVGQWAVFPKGANDDDVDAGTQAIRRLMQNYRESASQGRFANPASTPSAVPATGDVVGRRY